MTTHKVFRVVFSEEYYQTPPHLSPKNYFSQTVTPIYILRSSVNISFVYSASTKWTSKTFWLKG